MAVADELHRLKTMKDDGTLTDAEFAAAKASLLTPPPSPAPSAPQATANHQQKRSTLLDPKANAKAGVRVVVLIGVLGALIWLAVRMTAGGDAANRLAATMVKAPLDLRDEIENVPASSWKAVPLQLPYSGKLSIEFSVTRGNGLDAYVVDQSEVERIKSVDGRFRHYTEFGAEKATSYKRSGKLPSGTYYLVLRDKTLGILSASTSDVRVRARLEP